MDYYSILCFHSFTFDYWPDLGVFGWNPDLSIGYCCHIVHPLSNFKIMTNKKIIDKVLGLLCILAFVLSLCTIIHPTDTLTVITVFATLAMLGMYIVFLSQNFKR